MCYAVGELLPQPAGQLIQSVPQMAADLPDALCALPYEGFILLGLYFFIKRYHVKIIILFLLY